MMVDNVPSRSCSLLQKGKSVHPRHVDVADDHVDGRIGLQHRQGIDPVARKRKNDGALLDLAPELLRQQGFQIGLVVDDKNARAVHAACPIRDSISLRSVPKSIGFVSSDSAPPSSALRRVSASP